MTDSQNINMRVPTTLRDRIVQSAQRNGQTVTAYVLGWLPDNYDRDTKTPPTHTEPEQR